MLLFLDIDGVMVPAMGWKSPDFLNDGFPAFSKKAVNSLQKILSEDDTIILTTSHKSKYSIDEWKNIFKKREVKIEKIKLLPENVNHASRKDEIMNWLNENIINEEFIIIDDDHSLNELPEYLKNHLIQTSSLIGLTEKHAEIIKSITLK
ncbi:MAG: hypothetical protein FGM46_09325 [Ferruginibacter sp.]|nr:hypothetical protein [Ferruginibacter sp.]